MGETELRLQAIELNRLVILCQCGTEMVFAAKATADNQATKVHCPNCRYEVPGATAIVHAYRAFIGQLADHRDRVLFAVKLPPQ